MKTSNIKAASRYAIILLLCVNSLFVIGCNGKIPESEIVGSYTANCATANVSLDLFSDGKFRQLIIVMNTTNSLDSSGLWTYDDSRITLYDNYLNVLNGFGEPIPKPSKGTVSLPVFQRYGNIKIGGEPGLEFKKYNSK